MSTSDDRELPPTDPAQARLSAANMTTTLLSATFPDISGEGQGNTLEHMKAYFVELSEVIEAYLLG